MKEDEIFLTLKKAWEEFVLLLECDMQYERVEHYIMKKYEISQSFIVHFELQWQKYKEDNNI